jgi:predicted AlkP superfamily pyrophosphatase or phosphodiesterase
MSHQKYTLRLAVIFLCVLLVVTAIVAVDQPAALKALVISLDGGRADALLEADMPNLKALSARGAATWEASTVYPPVTIPAHTSMLTGLDVEEHGIDHNSYSTDTVEAPTFLTLASDAGYKTGMVVGKEKFLQFHQRDDVYYEFARQGDRSVVDSVLTLIDADYEVIFAHFPNPDYFGHSREWMSETYINELTNTDRQIGRLLEKLEGSDTLIIITADHGGLGDRHGRDIPEDMLIPWIIAGPNVREGYTIESDVYVTDTAMTVLWELGLPLPESDLGKPVEEAFTEDARFPEH